MKAILHARNGRAPSSETLTPSSHKQRPPRIPKENVEPNCLAPESSLFRSPPVSAKSPTVRNRSPLPPRPPPSSNPLKRKLNLETQPENGSSAALPCDSGVQVIVRVRPLNRKEVEEGSQFALKISHNSISILDHTFTFDSVADASSRQQDIFQLVGVPLVENCLAGFNSSIFAYGQTGSGKTYTMWGPCGVLTADGSLSNESGLTPRVFELLFSRINEEQSKNSEKQLSYQCRCSFLEIYNEQITDLLDPAQRNLQIREDVRAGVYVDCLSEEYIYQMKDAIHLLVKGLSNRRTGATSINAESSRSHCVFTCVVECRSKRMDDGISSLRTSRINFVDLAGSERQKVTCAVGERLKEAGNINRSLSQLGNLINILAEVSQSGKHRHIPYRDSRLTFLLQDSLGGNAKLAMICAISPSQSCKTETFSTLRFAQRAKVIKNQAVVNETREDDVNFLREQIRQLKDELLRMKSSGTLPDSNGGSTTWNVQRSLNLLRLSLCRPRTLPVVEDDSDEEMEIVEEGVERTCGQVPSTTNEENKNNANEELSTLKSLKELTPDHSDKVAIPNDMCPMEVVEKTCVEVPTTTDDDNRKNSNKEPSMLKSLKELARDGSDRESVHSDMCPIKVFGSGIMSDQHVGLRIISMKGSEAEQTAIEECRMNGVCGEEEMSVIQVSSIPNMKEQISQEDCKQKMMHSMAEPFDDLGTEIFLAESAVSGNSAGADVPNQHDGIIQEGLMQEMVLDRAHSTDGRVPEEADVSDRSHNCSQSQLSPCNLDIETCKTSLSLSFPTSNVSPRYASCSRKSLKRSSLMSASEGNLSLGLDSDLGVQNASLSDNINHSNSHVQSIPSGTNSLVDNIKNSNCNAQSFVPITNSSAITKNLEASLSQGLQIIDSHQHTSSLRNSLFRSSLRPVDVRLLISMNKVDAGVQTISQDSNPVVDTSAFICSYCHKKAPPVHCNNSTELAGLQIVHMDYPTAGTSQSAERYKKLVPKAVEKVLAGAIRREMALEDHCAKQAAEINHLNRLVQQYKHERECTEIIELTREDKISRLEALMDGIIPSEDFMHEEFVSLKKEHMILKEKFENHPDVLRLNIELKRVQNELDGYRNFFDMGERDVLMEEIQDLRCQLQWFIDSSSMSTCGKNPVLPFTHSTAPNLSPLVMIPETREEIAHENLEEQRHYWSERERWINLTDGLRREIKASQSLADRLRIELESEKKCTEELKEALQTALEVHTRTLEQHAELEEKHIALLGRHRKMREGIADVKNAAARAGLKGGESKFIESLAAQIEALRAEREKERKFWRNENIGLQKQLRDTAEAVEAAGELLGRLKEAEECAATSKKRAVAAEKRTEKAYREINDLKKNYETEIATLNQLLAESRSLKVPEAEQSAGQPWFYGYDRCNI